MRRYSTLHFFITVIVHCGDRRWARMLRMYIFLMNGNIHLNTEQLQSSMAWPKTLSYPLTFHHPGWILNLEICIHSVFDHFCLRITPVFVFPLGRIGQVGGSLLCRFGTGVWLMNSIVFGSPKFHLEDSVGPEYQADLANYSFSPLRQRVCA